MGDNRKSDVVLARSGPKAIKTPRLRTLQFVAAACRGTSPGFAQRQAI